MSAFFLMLNCFADIAPHGAELNRYLPGNNSHFEFTSCTAANHLVNGSGKWKISQRTCMGKWCKTIWSYSGDVYVKIELDGTCGVSNVNVWTVPSNYLLDSLTKKASEVLKEKFQNIFTEKPEYKQICE